MKTYYEILGVDKNASDSDIKKAYKKFVVKNHPDKFPADKKEEATKRFHDVQEAYETLSDPNKKQLYDSVGHDSYKNGFNSAGNGAGGFDFFGGGGFDFNDIFEAFSGHGSFRSREEIVGVDLRYKVELTLEEAFNGCCYDIKIPRNISCVECSGSGYNRKSIARTCVRCNGRGKTNVQQFFFNITQECGKCNGTGKIYDNCVKCSGSGVIYENSKLSIKIPRGVKDGMKLRMANEGSCVKGGKAGDLYIFVSIKKHKIFKVDGENLLVTLPITVFDAMVGVELKIPGIDGNLCLVNVPSGTQPNSKVIIKESGMIKMEGSNRGDLIVSFDIEIPKKLSEVEKELVVKLKQEYLKNYKSKSLFEKLYSYWTS